MQAHSIVVGLLAGRFEKRVRTIWVDACLRLAEAANGAGVSTVAPGHRYYLLVTKVTYMMRTANVHLYT